MLENRSWKQNDLQLREYNDELTHRIARLEDILPFNVMADDGDYERWTQASRQAMPLLDVVLLKCLI